MLVRLRRRARLYDAEVVQHPLLPCSASSLRGRLLCLGFWAVRRAGSGLTRPVQQALIEVDRLPLRARAGVARLRYLLLHAAAGYPEPISSPGVRTGQLTARKRPDHIAFRKCWLASRRGPRMSNTVIRRAARMLNPSCPTRDLARLAHAPKSTAKSWSRGQRRAPLAVLEIVHDQVVARRDVLNWLAAELQADIASRKRERISRRGFSEIRVRTAGSDPIDGRNRLGRPATGSNRRSVREI